MKRASRILKQIADWGLFIARLNNGDWMAGRANRIYSMDITQDHYSDPNLSISPSLEEAVEKAKDKIKEQK